MSVLSSTTSLTAASAARLKGVFNKAVHATGKAGSAVHALATNQPMPAAPNAGLVQGHVLNCYKAVHDYVTRMVTTVHGMKAMLLDTETTPMVGLVYSQTDLVAAGVFLVESAPVVVAAMEEERAEEAALRARVGKRGAIMKSENVGINEQNMQHLTAVAFLQPTAHTLDTLKVLLKCPRYKEYHIFFNNILPGGFLEALADLDVFERIKSVHEFFADYYSVAPSLFHGDATLEKGAALIAKKTSNFASSRAWQYDRDFQGLISAMLSLKKRPDIRYAAGSETCKRLAQDLVSTMNQEQELFTFNAGEAPTLLLIMDRRDDVVTPLLTQWTYQAMVHELLGIKHNRINLTERSPAELAAEAAAAASGNAPVKTPEQRAADALRDVILSSEQDSFFRSSMFVNFGELGLRIKKLVADFQSLTKTQSKLESVEDMQRFVDNYPQFRLQSGTVAKHVSVMGEISKVVNQRQLLTVSAVEQSLVCGGEHAENYEKLRTQVMDEPKIAFMDKLRCVLLYALRYENHAGNHLAELRNSLRAHARLADYSEQVVELIERVLGVSGAHTRTWPLFADHADLSLKSVVKQLQSMQGVDNIFTQHRPVLHDILTKLFEGELRTVQFPFAESGSVKTIYRRVIIYIVGGATFEEFSSVESLVNSPRYKGNFTTLLGGSCIHNSTSFLRDIADVDSYKLSAQQGQEQRFGQGAQYHHQQQYHATATGGEAQWAPQQPALHHPQQSYQPVHHHQQGYAQSSSSYPPPQSHDYPPQGRPASASSFTPGAPAPYPPQQQQRRPAPGSSTAHPGEVRLQMDSPPPPQQHQQPQQRAPAPANSGAPRGAARGPPAPGQHGQRAPQRGSQLQAPQPGQAQTQSNSARQPNSAGGGRPPVRSASSHSSLGLGD